MNLNQIIFGKLLVLALLSSCASPQKLVNKAIKKDPEVLTPYLLQAIPEDADSSCFEIKLEPRYINPVLTPTEYRKLRKQEEKTERVKARQEGKTRRREVKEETKKEEVKADIIQDSLKTERTRIRREARVEKEQEDTKQLEIRKNSFPWFWIIAVVVAFIIGYLTKGNEKIYGKLFRGVYGIVRRFIPGL